MTGGRQTPLGHRHDARRGAYDHRLDRRGRARASPRRRRAGRSSAQRQRDGSSVVPGRETVIGAYTGAPYNYPSAARVERRARSISPSIRSTGTPIRSRARSTTAPASQHWFAGGKTGGYGGFHPLESDRPARRGSRILRHPRRPAAAATRAHRRRREQARVLARPQHAAVQRPRTPARHRRRASARTPAPASARRCRIPRSS